MTRSTTLKDTCRNSWQCIILSSVPNLPQRPKIVIFALLASFLHLLFVLFLISVCLFLASLSPSCAVIEEARPPHFNVYIPMMLTSRLSHL